MQETLMYDPLTEAQMFVSASNINDIGKLKDKGWIQNPRLIAIYNPTYKKHLMVPVQEAKKWENEGYFTEPTMIYHPKEATRMVSAEEAKKALQNGWYASPAHFPGNSEGRIKTPNVSKEAA